MRSWRYSKARSRRKAKDGLKRHPGVLAMRDENFGGIIDVDESELTFPTPGARPKGSGKESSIRS